MTSWNEVYRFGSADKLPQWMRMSLGSGTSSPQAVLCPEVRLHPGQPYGYNDGYDSGYNAEYHHSECKPERPMGHQSNHRFWWTAPRGYDPPKCEMVVNVPVCCDGSHKRVIDGLIEIEGVRGVDVDRENMEVTVSGTFSPKEILSACIEIFKRSNWQPVPNQLTHCEAYSLEN